MASHYAPLDLQGQLHDMPQNYAQQLPLFDSTWDFTSQQHLDKMSDFIDLEEVDHNDVKM